MRILNIAFSAVIAYLIGSLNFSLQFSKGGIRKRGSGNPGATNTARVYGIAAGLGTFLFDFVKAAVAIAIARLLDMQYGLITGGFFALLGHCFPVFYHFKGGKGISCGAAIGLMMDWRIFVGLVIVFLAVVLISRKVSLGSVLAAVALPILAAVFQMGTITVIFAALCTILVLFRHRDNIKRLIQGTEPNFRAKKS